MMRPVALSLLVLSPHLLGCIEEKPPDGQQPLGDGSGGAPGGTDTGGIASSGGSAVGDTGGTGPAGGGTGGGAVATGGSSLGTGGMDGTGGSGSGGAPINDGVTALLSEFSAFWDFESRQGQSVLPSVGDATLELEGATVGPGIRGSELTIADGTTTASTATPVLDTTSDFSVSLWVRLDQLDGYDTFVGMDGTVLSSFYLQKRDDERLSFATFSADSTATSACVATGQIRPRQGEWYHVVGTYDAATGDQRVYVDGVLSGKATCSSGVFGASGGLSVGRGLYDGVGSDPWAGSVDDLGLIARVLSPSEIVSLYRHGRPDQKNYLFAFFIEIGQGRGDGLRLAHSHDGLHWGAIGAGKVFMPASVGGGSFRDPHLSRTPDNLYHLVWTTSCVPWAEANCVQDRGLGHATSPDLVNWSAADYITVDLNVEHVWAPEVFYDAETDQSMIFWSSPIDNNPSASDPHSIYYILTQDFESFSDPEILVQRPGRDLIDATLLDRGDEYLMVIKDEAEGQKNLRALASAELFGPNAWTAEPSAPITGNYAAEGPSFLEREGRLYVYFDKYGEGAYGALEASTSAALDSPSAWQDVSESVFFPGVRHGTPIEVPWDVFESVAKEAAAQ